MVPTSEYFVKKECINETKASLNQELALLQTPHKTRTSMHRQRKCKGGQEENSKHPYRPCSFYCRSMQVYKNDLTGHVKRGNLLKICRKFSPLKSLTHSRRETHLMTWNHNTFNTRQKTSI